MSTGGAIAAPANRLVSGELSLGAPVHGVPSGGGDDREDDEAPDGQLENSAEERAGGRSTLAGPLAEDGRQIERYWRRHREQCRDVESVPEWGLDRRCRGGTAETSRQTNGLARVDADRSTVGAGVERGPQTVPRVTITTGRRVPIDSLDTRLVFTLQMLSVTDINSGGSFVPAVNGGFTSNGFAMKYPIQNDTGRVY